MIGLGISNIKDIPGIKEVRAGDSLIWTKPTSFTYPEGTVVVSNYAMNETSGDMIDTVNGYNGTIVGTPNRDGEWYNFSGGNFSVQIPDYTDHSLVKSTGEQTFIELTFNFIKRSGNGAPDWFVDKRNSSGGLAEWGITHYGNGIGFVLYGNGSASSDYMAVYSKALSENVPYFIRMRYDGSTFRDGITIYVDEELNIGGAIGKTSLTNLHNSNSKTTFGMDARNGNPTNFSMNNFIMRKVI